MIDMGRTDWGGRFAALVAAALPGKIIRTARSVVMKLSAKYPYQDKVYSEKTPFLWLNPLFPLNSGWKKPVPISDFDKNFAKNDAKWRNLC
jgi:hypothetical protein